MSLSNLLELCQEHQRVKIYSTKFCTTIFNGCVDIIRHNLTQDVLYEHLDSKVISISANESVIEIFI